MGKQIFGQIGIPATWSQGPLLLKTTYDEKTIRYCRKLEDETVEKKIVLKRETKFIINPVEPVNTPKPLTTHLLIELDHPVVIEPQSDCTLFLTCPVEFGVFINDRNKNRLIDVFSLEPQKYTLYGNPKDGVICRYWRSEVHLSLPAVSPYVNGVMELSIINDTPYWSEISRAVFDSYLMTLFYNDEMILMKGNMKIVDKEVAETGFENGLPGQGMEQSIELYSLSKLNIIKTVFVMEHGL